MVIAGVVIQTAPGAVGAVEGRLGSVPGLEVWADDGDSRIAAVWRGGSGEELEEMGEHLVEADEAILGVFPTFAGEDREDA